ncbi:MAG TPA: SprT-like domain-containing protein [Kofleriaceae bacterium]|jgi:hypothetical protein
MTEPTNPQPTNPQPSSDPTKEQFAAFRAMYDYFNHALFADALHPVLLNFSRAANTLGFFAPERWKRGETTTHEISLNPSYLAERDARETASTLVHEMVHCWQQEYGRPSRRGYHNEEWATQMEAVGLMPSDTRAVGGKRTGYRVSHYILEGGPFAAAFDAMTLSLPWLCGEPVADAKVKKPRLASKVKYSCPSCDANAWGKPGLHLTCADCDEAMPAGDATDGTTTNPEQAELRWAA